jgi:hypothetical protein
MRALNIIFLWLIFMSFVFLTPNNLFAGEDAPVFSIRDSWPTPTVRYCQGDECWVQQGTELIKNSLWDIETDRTASQYIQDIVAYLLTFLALIAVIYIIYAGFNIMIWNGDEEKLKKSRQTIIYVLLWLVVIFLAWPITLFMLNILNVS